MFCWTITNVGWWNTQSLTINSLFNHLPKSLGLSMQHIWVWLLPWWSQHRSRSRPRGLHMQGDYCHCFLFQQLRRTLSLVAVTTEEHRLKASMTWDVVAPLVSTDAVLMVQIIRRGKNRSGPLFLSGNSTAEGDNFMGCGDQELPEAPPEVPILWKRKFSLCRPGLRDAQRARPRKRLCGEVGLRYGVRWLQQVLVGRNGEERI